MFFFIIILEKVVISASLDTKTIESICDVNETGDDKTPIKKKK